MYHENIKTTDATGGAKAFAFGFLRGVLVAVAFTLISFALFACILAYSALSEGSIPVIAMVVETIGAVLSGYFTARRNGSHGFLSGIVAGIGYFLLIWCIAALASSTFYVGAHLWFMLLFYVVGGAVGGVLGVNLKSGRTNRRKR